MNNHDHMYKKSNFAPVSERVERGFDPQFNIRKKKLAYKDLPFYRRYPRAFVSVTTTAFLMLFFSKPIYDIFFVDSITKPASPPSKK